MYNCHSIFTHLVDNGYRCPDLIQWLKHELMSHWVIWGFPLKGKHPSIELQSQNWLVYLGIDLNPETGQNFVYISLGMNQKSQIEIVSS